MSCCWTLRQESWGRLRATEDSCGTIPGRVTASLEEVAILRSEWVFCEWGMDVIMCGPYIVQNGFIRYIKVRYERMCWCCKYSSVWQKGVRQSILSTHPSCLLQDWISFLKSNDSPGDLHRCECQSHRMLNRISCCSFITEASVWNRNCQSLFGYTGFIIYSNLNLLFWLAKSFPIILSRCYRLYWWYPLRPKLISVSLSVSLIPAVYDGPVVTNISFGKCCDVRFTVFMCFLALSVFDALFIAACELSVQLVLTLVWMMFCWSYRAADHLHRCYEPLIVN